MKRVHVKRVRRAFASALVLVIGGLTAGAAICEIQCLEAERAARVAYTRTTPDAQAGWCHTPGSVPHEPSAQLTAAESCEHDDAAPVLLARSDERFTSGLAAVPVAPAPAALFAGFTRTLHTRVVSSPPPGGPTRSSPILRI